MTVVSNDPSWWPHINANVVASYISAASCTMLVYDWALMFGQELQLIWRQRCSLMTVMYLCVRYGGILYSFVTMLEGLPSISVTNLGKTFSLARSWTSVVENAILGVIMITRLHAMYQGSRIMLIFLVVVFVTLTIPSIVTTGILGSYHLWEEFVLSGTYQCIEIGGSAIKLTVVTWILGSVWEVLALCLALRVSVKHFRDLRRFGPSTGQTTIEDCFTVLIKTHVLYFAAFAAVPCFIIGSLSPQISDSSSVGVQAYGGILQISLPVQMFVLGPRLILSIREYYAKVVVNSEAGTGITTIAFQERTHVSTGGDTDVTREVLQVMRR
ncbi:hypothetical protein DEU56DRAFT_834598 [Suillus clintonianus]|uniref:uncharacterized protein n=1 Tax=Suillus clintonianus TaxID=1904413 RepID=UPI001B86F229|nr:uncharacterized protein DEU56DRAFT_834598 [Suillus clintonianus]KAG2121259.1 hypothetical protein DEU56DRAFT_834598 [Suillus clintonianus]